jgi:carbon monoxide dehydrogenase subunit G
MKVSQSFRVSKPVPVVWELFSDIPKVARCMPGAELTEDKGGGVYAGRLGIKLGPFSASFDGEAVVTPTPDHAGHVEGRGVDKRGGSRSKLVMDYRLEPDGDGTRVTIDADVQLSGPVAQFGRSGIVNETTAILIGQFVHNVEATLAGGDAPEAAQLSAGSVAWQLVKSKVFKRGEE